MHLAERLDTPKPHKTRARGLQVRACVQERTENRPNAFTRLNVHECVLVRWLHHCTAWYNALRRTSLDMCKYDCTAEAEVCPRVWDTTATGTPAAPMFVAAPPRNEWDENFAT